MITAVCWKWGDKFAPVYVNRLRSMLARHLHLPHELVCVTAEREGIDPRVRIVEPPAELSDTLRCRRRMWGFARERRADFGERILNIDLDVVIVDNITPILNRSEPIVGWRVGYAGVLSGSFLLYNAGALHGAWEKYRADPEGFPKATGQRNGSDQAMVNHWLARREFAHWQDSDGFVTWFGAGYERLEYLGMGPGRSALPPGARIVVLGSADKEVMDEGRYAFIREHWR